MPVRVYRTLELKSVSCPVIPLVDVVGKALNRVPEQIGVIPVNVGLTNEFTVMVNVCVVAHKPAVGVKV